MELTMMIWYSIFVYLSLIIFEKSSEKLSWSLNSLKNQIHLLVMTSTNWFINITTYLTITPEFIHITFKNNIQSTVYCEYNVWPIVILVHVMINDVNASLIILLQASNCQFKIVSSIQLMSIAALFNNSWACFRFHYCWLQIFASFLCET